MLELEVVVAMCYRSFGIGLRGALPWPTISPDLKHFAKLTSATPNPALRNAVIMGRKTFDSIPLNFRPLKNRINVVLSRNQELINGSHDSSVHYFPSLDKAIEQLKLRNDVHKVFVIGGEQIFRQTVQRPDCTKLHITQIYKEFECDTYFPHFDQKMYEQTELSSVQFDNDVAFQFFTFSKKASLEREISDEQLLAMRDDSHPENQYLNLIADILKNGVVREDRTGVGTIGVCGRQMRFSLRDDVFPLLTTKKVFWRGVAEELLWFVSGCTNANVLKDKGIHVRLFIINFRFEI
jgi:dihydrofolate reductase/thymidylate synthase